MKKDSQEQEMKKKIAITTIDINQFSNIEVTK